MNEESVAGRVSRVKGRSLKPETWISSFARFQTPDLQTPSLNGGPVSGECKHFDSAC